MPGRTTILKGNERSAVKMVERHGRSAAKSRVDRRSRARTLTHPGGAGNYMALRRRRAASIDASRCRLDEL